MTSRIVFFAAVVCAWSAFAAELAVPAQYPTIQKAVDAAKAGDVVLVKGGTYAGFRVQKLFEGAPLTIKAAPGERVTLSGMQKIEGWKDEGGGVFSAKVPSRVDSLFVGYVEQQCGRWPADGTRLPILTADAATCTFKTDPVADPKLAKLAKDPKDARCYFFFAAGNAFSSRRIPDSRHGKTTATRSSTTPRSSICQEAGRLSQSSAATRRARLERSTSSRRREPIFPGRSTARRTVSLSPSGTTRIRPATSSLTDLRLRARVPPASRSAATE